MKIVNDNGYEIDADCDFGFEDDLFGLVLESWGPTPRNAGYNHALKEIIARLKCKNITKIKVQLVTSSIVKNLPALQDRQISNHPDGFFHLHSGDADYSRLELCKLQRMFSATGKKDTPKGNGNKRILIHVPGWNSSLHWRPIIFGSGEAGLQSSGMNTEFIAAVNSLLTHHIPKPHGNPRPGKLTRQTVVYERIPEVVAWVLQNSHGCCESCDKEAPFLTSRNRPFLEVHHVISLSSGGADTVENCVALCPNCHRAMHHSGERERLIKALFEKVPRLSKSEVVRT